MTHLIEILSAKIWIKLHSFTFTYCISIRSLRNKIKTHFRSSILYWINPISLKIESMNTNKILVFSCISVCICLSLDIYKNVLDSKDHLKIKLWTALFFPYSTKKKPIHFLNRVKNQEWSNNVIYSLYIFSYLYSIYMFCRWSCLFFSPEHYRLLFSAVFIVYFDPWWNVHQSNLYQSNILFLLPTTFYIQSNLSCMSTVQHLDLVSSRINKICLFVLSGSAHWWIQGGSSDARDHPPSLKSKS